MIQYIGPVAGLASGHWFGVEIFVNYDHRVKSPSNLQLQLDFQESDRGTSNGTYAGKSYFSAPPYSSVFVNASQLMPYDYHRPLSDPPRAKTKSNNNLGVDSGLGRLRIVQSVGQAERYDRPRAYLAERYGKIWLMIRRKARLYLSKRAWLDSCQPNLMSKAKEAVVGYLFVLLFEFVINPTLLKVKSQVGLVAYIKSIVFSLFSDDKRPASKQSDVTEDGVQVEVGDRIVWLSDDGPEFGYVKWIGHVIEENSLLAGVEFVSWF